MNKLFLILFLLLTSIPATAIDLYPGSAINLYKVNNITCLIQRQYYCVTDSYGSSSCRSINPRSRGHVLKVEIDIKANKIYVHTWRPSNSGYMRNGSSAKVEQGSEDFLRIVSLGTWTSNMYIVKGVLSGMHNQSPAPELNYYSIFGTCE